MKHETRLSMFIYYINEVNDQHVVQALAPMYFAIATSLCIILLPILLFTELWNSHTYKNIPMYRPWSVIRL